MSYNLEKKLVVAVTSSAVFDMREADEVFRSKGEEEYRRYQREKRDVSLSPGVAFPFIRRLLKLNEDPDEPDTVEVVVLSRNDPDSGQRFFRSCIKHSLNITRGAFLTGGDTFRFVEAFSASLYLSANEKEVKEAVLKGLPAGLTLPGNVTDDSADDEFRVAFDFDGVLADDESERVYREGKSDLNKFHEYEKKMNDVPHKPGPLAELLKKLCRYQILERKRALKESAYKRKFRVAVVTARNAPSHERAINTLKSWGVEPDEMFLMGGVEKARVLKVIRPHVFFDDQINHLKTTVDEIPSVHIPFGVANAVE